MAASLLSVITEYPDKTEPHHCQNKKYQGYYQITDAVTMSTMASTNNRIQGISDAEQTQNDKLDHGDDSGFVFEFHLRIIITTSKSS